MSFTTKIIGLLGLAGALLLPDGARATTVTDGDRQDALAYIEGRLSVIDPEEAAFGYYLDAQEDLLSQEGDQEVIRSMAVTYRHEQFEEVFQAMFEPLSREVFQHDGIWHVVTLRGEKIASHVCYQHTSAQAVACP